MDVNIYLRKEYLRVICLKSSTYKNMTLEYIKERQRWHNEKIK